VDQSGRTPTHQAGDVHCLLYPVRLRALLAHEPPLVELLPDSAQVRAQIADTYDTYRSGGAGKAMGRFMVHAAWTMDPAGSRTPRWEPCA